MKKETYINSNTICSITVKDKWLDKDFVWYDQTKSLFTKKPEGFYCYRGFSFEQYYTETDIIKSSKYLVEDKQVYLKPDVTVTLVSNKSYVKYFDTYEEAQTYAAKLQEEKTYYQYE